MIRDMERVLVDRYAALFAQAEREHNLVTMRRVIKELEDTNYDKCYQFAQDYKVVLARIELLDNTTL